MLINGTQQQQELVKSIKQDLQMLQELNRKLEKEIQKLINNLEV